VRGDLLSYWEPEGGGDPDDRLRWEASARRIAAGLRELAHVAAAVDPEQTTIAFPCGSARVAAGYERAIRSENVEVRIVEDGAGTLGVALPCRPGATDEEIKHVVLAVVKAAHTVEFVPVDAEVLAQLETVQAMEDLFAGGIERLRRIGAGLRRAVAGAR